MDTIETRDTSGRQIALVPMPHGAWGVLLGAGLAALAPLGGFLVGTILGPGQSGATTSPLFLALFAGFVLGAVGVIVAIYSGVRLYGSMTAQRAAAEAAATP